MPLFIDFLTSRDPKVESFVEIAKGAMQESLDRYANAFDIVKLDFVENREALTKEYFALYTTATLENEALSSAHEIKIGRFMEKLFAIASFELLNEKGELKKEIMDAFQINALYQKIAGGEYSETHKANIDNLRQKNNLSEDEAIKLEVRNAFVKGFVAEIIMSILRTQGNRLEEWRNSEPDNLLIQTLVDTTVNKIRRNPLTIKDAITRLQNLDLIRSSNPNLFSQIIYNDQYYKINLKSYLKSNLLEEIDNIQKSLLELIKVLPKSKKTESYKQLFAANAANLLKEIQEKKPDNDNSFTQALIKTMKEETFKIAHQDTSAKFFKGADVLANAMERKLNDINSLIAITFYTPEFELKPLHKLNPK